MGEVKIPNLGGRPQNGVFYREILMMSIKFCLRQYDSFSCYSFETFCVCLYRISVVFKFKLSLFCKGMPV